LVVHYLDTACVHAWWGVLAGWFVVPSRLG
jgi:hypothetical protein